MQTDCNHKLQITNLYAYYLPASLFRPHLCTSLVTVISSAVIGSINISPVRAEMLLLPQS